MITLREAQFSDHAAIAKLHAENWRQHYRGILSDHYLDNEVEKERLDTWHERLKSPAKNQFITMAMLDETLVGFCCVYLDDNPDFGSLIDNFHVATNLHQSGIGKMLFKESAKKVYNNANTRKMYLWVFDANKKAKIVYERLGGRCFETIDKENEDGTVSRTCRYIWDDVSALL